MKKPDVIVTWPRHIDYPLFRYNMLKWRSYFNDVFISVSNHNQSLDLAPFLIDLSPTYNWQVITPPIVEGDWRHISVYDVIENFSRADDILFLEQDFLINNGNMFFDKLLGRPKPFIVYKEAERLHPAFALMSRDLLNDTSKNFSAKPGVYDHFFKVFSEASQIITPTTLTDLQFIEKRDFYHMAGLSTNYQYHKERLPFFKPDEFLTYNYYAKQVPNQNRQFYPLIDEIDGAYTHQIVEYIASFFPQSYADLSSL